ncbi:MAG: hypothetical protein R3D03_19700 [Geminicoccaceae bacterium]
MRLFCGSALLLTILAATAPVSSIATAGESKAKSWGLNDEEAAVVEGKVVDLLCELSGDCPTDCGNGDRQLGALTNDDRLIAISKNGQPAFNGAVSDLLPYCGKVVEMDGLFTGQGSARVYQVQLIREKGAADWSKANLWTEIRAHSQPPLLPGDGPWFRRDPRVLERIERDGYLGLGKETDAEFIAEW